MLNYEEFQEVFDKNLGKSYHRRVKVMYSESKAYYTAILNKRGLGSSIRIIIKYDFHQDHFMLGIKNIYEPDDTWEVYNIVNRLTVNDFLKFLVW